MKKPETTNLVTLSLEGIFTTIVGKRGYPSTNYSIISRSETKDIIPLKYTYWFTFLPAHRIDYRLHNTRYVCGQQRWAVWFFCAQHQRQITLCTLLVHALLFDVKNISFYILLFFNALRYNWGGTAWTGDLKYREVKTGFCRKIQMQTSSSETIIG